MQALNREQIAALDDAAIQNGLEVRQMMELAGWHIVEVFARLQVAPPARVTIAVGKGNKGGDGLAAARHLANRGFDVRIVLADDALAPNAEHQRALLSKMNVPTTLFADAAAGVFAESDIVVDALIGYNLSGAPRSVFAEMVEAINRSSARIISYDIPTGVDATTGECFEPCVHAEATLTLAAPKRAFETESGRQASGKVFVGDIGIPRVIYDEVIEGSRPQFEDGLISFA